ncbi:EpsG family protein [Sphingomonas ginkgonis]|uniref:EpsG family protein n=1 Tax=Sphingomonas ginkgonis TaxID=2315330 RepID=A0A429VAH1_9SPHN|nr:EpsG family protein [Sphingomonas ginkgonis]RST30807.1 EpsG family protein [Sphingomonas ginkgonis]
MTPYFLMFAFFVFGALARPPQPADTPRRGDLLLLIGAVILILMVGLRYQVGGDWRTYAQIFRLTETRDLPASLTLADPGYMVVNWLVQQVGGGIWLVNSICALIYTWGLIRFARSQPDPWLAVIVGIPYLTVVVAMGYTRQAVAIGIIMAGLAAYGRYRSLPRFILYVAIATTFHKTAVLFLPLVIFSARRNRLFNLIGGFAAGYIIYANLLTQASDQLIKNYVNSDYSSQGAAIRVALDVVPASLFLLRSRAFGFGDEERALWRNCSLASFLFVGMLFFLPSTVTDRLALYIIPLQLAVLSRVPGVYTSETTGRVLVIAYSFAIMAAWLTLASFASLWVPYQFYFAH